MEYKSLFSCSSDLSVCLSGFCFPWCLSKSTTYKLITGKPLTCFSLCCVPIPATPFYTRKLINREFGIENSDCSDCLVSCCCIPCSVIQNENNLKAIEKRDKSI